MGQSKYGSIPIDTVVEDFFVRQRVNEDHVLHLATLYDSGVKLPAVQITRVGNRLIDGRHRLAALKYLERKGVEVEWIDETDTATLIARAVKANVGGSLPPTTADIVYAIQQMIEVGTQYSVIVKTFGTTWPASLIRRYHADAQSNLTGARLIKAKAAVVENGMTVDDAAKLHKIKSATLKDALNGKKRRKGGTTEIKGTLTKVFRSRGGTMAAILRRVQERFEDGEISWAQVNTILEHSEQLCKRTTHSVRDWRKRLEAKAGKTPKKDAAA